jgi:hypothetical protein
MTKSFAQREHEAFTTREMHLALYGMFLVASNTQPDVKLPWHEQLCVELGAEEYDDYLETI